MLHNGICVLFGAQIPAWSIPCPTGENNMARNKKKTTLRPALQILCAILGVVFAVLLAGTLYAERLLGSMNFEGNGFREHLTL
jgi:hypothetical protein